MLQAERTQFKVHRGVLAMNSSIFNYLFSVPQPLVDHEDSVDGCIVVHLSDAAKDVEILLPALIKRE